LPAGGCAVALRDGTPTLIRRLARDDDEPVRCVFERLSDESRHGRFLGPKPELTAADLAHLSDVDGHDHEALVCVEKESGQPLGIARFIRLRDDPEVAEAAVAVVDEAQGRGVGTALMNALAERAQEERIRRFRAVLLADNAKSVRVLEQLGSVRRGRVERGVVEMEVELPVGRASAVERARVLRAAATGIVRLGMRLPGGFSLLFGWTVGDAEGGQSQAPD
jgi:RimJ/RimL family protein N-acetyltransferase